MEIYKRVVVFGRRRGGGGQILDGVKDNQTVPTKHITDAP